MDMAKPVFHNRSSDLLDMVFERDGALEARKVDHQVQARTTRSNTPIGGLGFSLDLSGWLWFALGSPASELEGVPALVLGLELDVQKQHVPRPCRILWLHLSEHRAHANPKECQIS